MSRMFFCGRNFYQSSCHPSFVMGCRGYTTIIWYEEKLNCRLNIPQHRTRMGTYSRREEYEMRHSVSAACRVFLSLSLSSWVGTCSLCTAVYNVHVIGHMMSSGSGRWFSNVNFPKNQFDSQKQIRRGESNWTNGEICRWTLDADRIQCTLHEACVYHCITCAFVCGAA